MIGKNYNKTHQQGQVLLITVMLLATAITIVMTVAFNTTTETQIGVLEQESQKALTAAEAGLELALKNSPGAALSLDGLVGSGITGTAEVYSIASPVFTSPPIQRDESYTFYLGDYRATSPPEFLGTYYTGNVSLYFGEKECGLGGTVLEILQVKNDVSSTFNRYLVDPCNYMNKPTFLGVSAGLYTIEGNTYYYRSDMLAISADTKLLIVRVLYNGTKVAIESSVQSNKLPLQGKTVGSTAKTDTGVTKRIQLFQSYPQIPTDFFVTAF